MTICTASAPSAGPGCRPPARLAVHRLRLSSTSSRDTHACCSMAAPASTLFPSSDTSDPVLAPLAGASTTLAPVAIASQPHLCALLSAQASFLILFRSSGLQILVRFRLIAWTSWCLLWRCRDEMLTKLMAAKKMRPVQHMAFSYYEIIWILAALSNFQMPADPYQRQMTKLHTYIIWKGCFTSRIQHSMIWTSCRPLDNFSTATTSHHPLRLNGIGIFHPFLFLLLPAQCAGELASYRAGAGAAGAPQLLAECCVVFLGWLELCARAKRVLLPGRLEVAAAHATIDHALIRERRLAWCDAAAGVRHTTWSGDAAAAHAVVRRWPVGQCHRTRQATPRAPRQCRQRYRGERCCPNQTLAPSGQGCHTGPPVARGSRTG